MPDRILRDLLLAAATATLAARHAHAAAAGVRAGLRAEWLRARALRGVAAGLQWQAVKRRAAVAGEPPDPAR